jgi:hypothetical protein
MKVHPAWRNAEYRLDPPMKLVHPIDVSTYRSHPAINVSSLKAFSRSALHASAGFEEEKEPTDAMNIGSLLDHKVLGTPYLWTTSPYDDYRTKDARAWRDEQEARGVTVFKQDAIETVERMVQAVRAHPVAGRIFAEPGKAQVGMFGEFESCERKGLIDWLPTSMPVIVDLKKCRDASRHGFRRQIGQLRYDVQAAYYRDLYRDITGETREWQWVCVEDVAPYAVAVYQLGAESLDKASATWQSWIRQWMVCEDTDSWPGYNGDSTEIIQSPNHILRDENFA